MSIMEKPVSKTAGGLVGEFFIEARLEALNAALAAHGVVAEPRFAWTPTGSSQSSRCRASRSPTGIRPATTSSTASPEQRWSAP